MDDFVNRVSLRAYEIWEHDHRSNGRAVQHWLEAERQIRAETEGTGSADAANEGEGSRTAAKAYNRDTTAFAKSGRVKAKAREAAVAIDGPEGPALRAAEETGRRHSHGEDPAVKRSTVRNKRV
jgi:hypothetical protein